MPLLAIPFPAIAELIRKAMERFEKEGVKQVETLAAVREIDRWARDLARHETRKVKSNV